jgi:hypothetical protein
MEMEHEWTYYGKTRAGKAVQAFEMQRIVGVSTARGYWSQHARDWQKALTLANTYARATGLRHVVYRNRMLWEMHLWCVAPAHDSRSGWCFRRRNDLERTGHDWRTTR